MKNEIQDLKNSPTKTKAQWVDNIGRLVITLLGTIITLMVIPWLKTKIDSNQWQTLQDWAKVGVCAAEVLFKGTNLGKDKLAYVTKYLNEMCEKYNYHFDETTVRQAIENAWKNMTNNEKDKVA